MECPKFGGSQYYNYKGFHSTVLMALCDSQYRFTYVSIGSFGRDNDASIFSKSDLFKLFEDNTANVPSPDHVSAGDTEPTPYYLIGDEIFALKTWLMKPYPGRGLNTEERVFNYRLSRARRTIENAFGILSARWRVFMRPIRADVSTVDSIVRACVCLHNYLLTTENARYMPSGFVDSDSSDGMVEGDWRKIVREDGNLALAPPGMLAGRNHTFDAKQMRDRLSKYVNGAEGTARCPWQRQHVTSTGRTNNPVS